MAVLVHLAEANGAVVARNELLDAVWPRMAVTPDALSQCLVELRHAFGDDSKNPRTIETIRRIGVRLIAPVAVEESNDPAPATMQQTSTAPESNAAGTPADASLGHKPQRLSRMAVAAVAVVVAFLLLGAVVLFWPTTELRPASATAQSGGRSIAVLPFGYDEAADDRLRLFAEGIHDELLIRLASIGTLDNIPSRAVVLRYRGTNKTAQQIGRELGVDAVLEGRVRGVDDAIGLNVQLIDTATNAVLGGYSDTKTLTAQSFFAIQAEMTLAIAAAVDAQLSVSELAQLRQAPTTNTRAYEHYLRGREYSRRNTDPNTTLPLIVQQYERATEEDPGFASAWARLSMAYTGLYFRAIDRNATRLAAADAAVRRAFELAPDLPEAHLAKATLLARGLGDNDGALAELAVAEPRLRQDPELYSLRSFIYFYIEEYDLALADNDELIRLDPGSVTSLRGRHQFQFFKGDFAAAEQTLRRILELAPDDGTAYVDLVALALRADGDTALANQYEQSPPSSSYATALGSTCVRWLAAIFDRDYARAVSILDGSREEPVFDCELRNSFVPKSLLYARTHLLAGNQTDATSYFLEAQANLEQQLTSPAEQEPFQSLRVALAEVLAARGDRAGAAESLALAGIPPTAPQRFAWQRAAAIRVLLPSGDHERAIAELDDLLSKTDSWTVEGLLADPRLDSVRNAPGFTALIAKHQAR